MISPVAFVRDQADLLAAAVADGRYRSDQAGHDFYMTRCGHGCGYWDRDLGEVGERLTQACRPYGGCTVLLYHDEDGALCADVIG